MDNQETVRTRTQPCPLCRTRITGEAKEIAFHIARAHPYAVTQMGDITWLAAPHGVIYQGKHFGPIGQ